MLERRYALIARGIARLDTGEMLENPVGRRRRSALP